MKPALPVPGPGRPLGIRNKVSKKFLEDVYESWQKHGRDALEYMGKRKPIEFARLVAGVLPKELIFESVSDATSVEDLDVIINTLRQHLLSKPGEPLLIEGEVIHELDRSPAGTSEGAAGASGGAQTAAPRRR
jgi:hypothetical protein